MSKMVNSIGVFTDQINQCPALLSVKLLLFCAKYSQESSFRIGPSLGIHNLDVPRSASHHGLNNNGFDLGNIVLFVFMCNQGNNLAKSLHTYLGECRTLWWAEWGSKPYTVQCSGPFFQSLNSHLFPLPLLVLKPGLTVGHACWMKVQDDRNTWWQ